MIVLSFFLYSGLVAIVQKATERPVNLGAMFLTLLAREDERRSFCSRVSLNGCTFALDKINTDRGDGMGHSVEIEK